MVFFHCFCSQQSKQYTPWKLQWNLNITLLKSCEKEKSSKPSLASLLEGWQDAVTYKDSNSFLDFALAAPSEITASVELNKHSKWSHFSSLCCGMNMSKNLPNSCTCFRAKHWSININSIIPTFNCYINKRCDFLCFCNGVCGHFDTNYFVLVRELLIHPKPNRASKPQPVMEISGFSNMTLGPFFSFELLPVDGYLCF